MRILAAVFLCSNNRIMTGAVTTVRTGAKCSRCSHQSSLHTEVEHYDAHISIPEAEAADTAATTNRCIHNDFRKKDNLKRKEDRVRESGWGG